MQSYKNWQLLEELPKGWALDKTAGSPLHGYEFCTNGKSIISGCQKRALVRVLPPQLQIGFDVEKEPIKETEKEKKNSIPRQVIDANYVRTVNELAREKFKLKLLNDILTDLMICEIEGWSKMEYINEIRRLVNEIGSAVCIEA